MDPSLLAVQLPRARLLAVALPPAFRPPRTEHDQPHVAIVLAGCLGESEASGTRELFRGQARLASARAPHNLEAGPLGLRCLIVELPSGTPWRAAKSAARSRHAGDPELTLLAEAFTESLEAPAPAARVRALRLGAEVGARAARLARGIEGHEMPLWLAELRAELARDPLHRDGLFTLGRRAGVHPMHVARSFREHHGCSIGEWLRLHRLERACELLARQQPPLVEVAAEAGFADQAHLTRCLARTLGTTPGRLRRAAR